MKELLKKLEITTTKEDIKQEKARKSLLEFTLYTKPNYKLNWHNELICRTLDDFLVNPNFNRLMIFMPPRDGKTELVSRRLPAYAFGKNPNLNIIATSYSADLAQRNNRDVQKIIDNSEYSNVFSETKLFGSNIRTVAKGSYLRNSDIFEIVDYNGAYRSSGIGGGITGMGFNIGIIDDPFKNWKEANSATVREAVWEWYTSTFYTRGENDEVKGIYDKIIIIMTRWHQDDLAGRLIKQMEEDPEAEQWKIISFPAIFDGKDKYTHPEDPRQIGEALFPQKRSKEKLLKIKKTIGTYLFNALFQQKPSPPEGSILKRGWWKYYKRMPDKFDELIQSWDCAFKDTITSSYVSGQVWGRIGANKYLLARVKDKMDFPTTVRAIVNLSAKWTKTYRKYIEDKANGPAVIATLKDKISGLIPVEPEGSKIARAHAVSGDIESGNVYIPDSSLDPQIADFVDECAAFPLGKFKDQVDAMTQALNKLRGHSDSDPLSGNCLEHVSEIETQYPGQKEASQEEEDFVFSGRCNY